MVGIEFFRFQLTSKVSHTVSTITASITFQGNDSLLNMMFLTENIKNIRLWRTSPHLVYFFLVSVINVSLFL